MCTFRPSVASLKLPFRDFAEAFKITAKAKSQFLLDSDDLYKRGYRLIRESVECGVTSMRTHVEVDTSVKFTCLDVGLRLSKEWQGICEIQVSGEL
jgi:cytosine/adenosine deaminase-related metal-dependent hydrolase